MSARGAGSDTNLCWTGMSPRPRIKIVLPRRTPARGLRGHLHCLLLQQSPVAPCVVAHCFRLAAILSYDRLCMSECPRSLTCPLRPNEAFAPAGRGSPYSAGQSKMKGSHKGLHKSPPRSNSRYITYRTCLMCVLLQLSIASCLRQSSTNHGGTYSADLDAALGAAIKP